MLECPVEQRGADAVAAKLGIHKDHAYPGESPFINNRRGSSDDASGCFGGEAALGAGVEESLPVGFCLVPSRQVLQPHSGRNVRTLHDPYSNVHKFFRSKSY